MEVKSLSVLKEKVYHQGIRVKQKKRNKELGKEASPLSIASLHRILRDPLYVGKIRLKKDGSIYPGVHKAIIDKQNFTLVQEQLSINNNRGDAVVESFNFTSPSISYPKKFIYSIMSR